MRLLITTPTLRPHGGIRVLVEWANHLARRGHKTTLQIFQGPIRADWIDINPDVQVKGGIVQSISEYDCVVAGTPFIALHLDSMQGAKKFFLLQMAEDLFSPGNHGYVEKCRQSYHVKMPIIGISKWVEEYVRDQGRTGKMYYIGNGVTENFTPGEKSKELTVLVEGWNGYNPAKDWEHINAQVADALKKEYGAKIVSYSQAPPTHNEHILDEYYTRPDPEQIVRLYQQATIMVKATRYDARSCAPVEAMACGTVTARGLMKGDDDLFHEMNCLRGGYKYDEVLTHAKRLIEDEELREQLEQSGLQYRKKWLSWDYWMGEVEKIFEGKKQPEPLMKKVKANG